MRKTLAVLTAASAALGASAAAQTPKNPVATYWVSASTASGPMAGAAGPGAMSPGALLGAMSGRQPSAVRTLNLQLGSKLTPSGAPDAAHLPPTGLKAGARLPLLSPERSQARDEPEPYSPQDMMAGKPKGRMLIYWGCGEQTRPGQPLVVDFSKPETLGKLNFASFAAMQPPSPDAFATYGEWPNRMTRNPVITGSLLGEHRVEANYAPPIQFSLSEGQDFLDPLNVRATDAASGAANLAWAPVRGARAYFATFMGASEDETMVFWSSSEAGPTMAMNDYLAPDEIARQLQRKALMGPETQACAIPAAAAKAAPMGFVNMSAYGGEANFAYPPRPSDPKVAWTPEWVAKVRYRSTSGLMLGMGSAMGGAMDRSEAEDDGAAPANAPTDPRGLARDILRGMVPLPRF